MLSRTYYKKDAVVEGERYALNLLKEYPHVKEWLPLAYEVSRAQFENPTDAIFEYNLILDVITRHTIFSKFVFDLIFYSDYRNLPVRSIQNGIGSTNIAAILFALYAVIIYWRNLLV